ncbi:MAG: phosphohistidine phosphatase SixA [Spirochaetes bacterium]|nr:phosphohistidine phosphatase SixA [Spirochaetota bacterium]
MHLFLIQHGKAKSKGEDPLRGITDQGREETQRMTVFLEKLNPEIQKIWHSSKKRSLETAKIFKEKLSKSVKMSEYSHLNPNDSIENIVKEINGTKDSVMIVGHLPFMDKLASYLLSADEDQNIVQFKNSGIVCLEKNNDHWRLLWAVVPDII